LGSSRRIRPTGRTSRIHSSRNTVSADTDVAEVWVLHGELVGLLSERHAHLLLLLELLLQLHRPALVLENALVEFALAIGPVRVLLQLLVLIQHYHVGRLISYQLDLGRVLSSTPIQVLAHYELLVCLRWLHAFLPFQRRRVLLRSLHWSLLLSQFLLTLDCLPVDSIANRFA